MGKQAAMLTRCACASHAPCANQVSAWTEYCDTSLESTPHSLHISSYISRRSRCASVGIMRNDAARAPSHGPSPPDTKLNTTSLYDDRITAPRSTTPNVVQRPQVVVSVQMHCHIDRCAISRSRSIMH